MAARRRSASVARRRSARVSRGPVTTIDGRYRAAEGAPHILSEHAGSVGGIAESSQSHHLRSGPRRLPVGARACSRPTRHPVQTPARRCHGGVASRRVDVVVSQPRSRPPSPQLDVAGTLSEGLPRRFRDTNDRSGVLRPNVRGSHLPLCSDPSIVVRGWGYPPRPRVGEQPPRRGAIDTRSGGAAASIHAPDARPRTSLHPAHDRARRRRPAGRTGSARELDFGVEELPLGVEYLQSSSRRRRDTACAAAAAPRRIAETRISSCAITSRTLSVPMSASDTSRSACSTTRR